MPYDPKVDDVVRHVSDGGSPLLGVVLRVFEKEGLTLVVGLFVNGQPEMMATDSLAFVRRLNEGE